MISKEKRVFQLRNTPSLGPRRARSCRHLRGRVRTSLVFMSNGLGLKAVYICTVRSGILSRHFPLIPA
jgi:hypothetical protein